MNAVTFEYEWMADGPLRVRFLDREDRILGQQMVAAEGLQALQMLITFAFAKAADVEPETITAMLSGGGDADPDAVINLMEAVRVRADITSEGDIGLHSIDDA